MTLIYYDTQTPKASLYDHMLKIREVVGNDILFLPKDFNVLLQASEEQLLTAKNTIEAALKLKKDN
jgi:hypothetical protein